MAAVDTGQTVPALVSEGSIRARAAESPASVGTADQQVRGIVEGKEKKNNKKNPQNYRILHVHLWFLITIFLMQKILVVKLEMTLRVLVIIWLV